MIANLLFLQGDSGGFIAALFGLCWTIFYFAAIVALVAGMWKMFQKAGEPGWAAIIPVYNMYILLKIGGLPGWFIIGFFIPFVNVLTLFFAGVKVAEAFAKDVVYGVVLLGFLAPVGYALLGFGDAQYTPPEKFSVNQL